jgi:hypothetical protein
MTQSVSSRPGLLGAPVLTPAFRRWISLLSNPQPNGLVLELHVRAIGVDVEDNCYEKEERSRGRLTPIAPRSSESDNGARLLFASRLWLGEGLYCKGGSFYFTPMLRLVTSDTHQL